VPNAGIFPQAKLEDMNPELWDEVMSTNLKAEAQMERDARP
jgi:NAD(P)-dependent dehydrogenase (short-subunit alcohol dehydrogenase family)